QIENAGLASRALAIVGNAILAIAPSTTDMMIPSAMVRMAHFRCGCGRPSACSITAVVSCRGLVSRDRLAAVPDGAYRQPSPAGPVPARCPQTGARVRNRLGALLIMRD